MSIRTAVIDAHIFVVTIDKPESRNALSRSMSKELEAAWLKLRDEPELRVAVLTGAGDKAFCAGADLREVGDYYRAMTPIQRRLNGERTPGLGGLTRNFDSCKPVIAAINGHCLAGGLELALACDLRVAAEHATFGLPEVKRGIMPGAGGTQRLPRLVPMGMALEMLLTGAPIDATTALRIGLVNRVVPQAELLESATSLARLIAQNAPLAVQAIRSAALRGLHLPLEEGLALEQAFAEPVRATADAQEGVRAFLEKREPRFTGQ